MSAGIRLQQPTSSIYFDAGGAGYLSIDTAATALPQNNDFYTIEAFIKTSTPGTGGICGWGDYGTGNKVNAFRLNDTGLLNYWWANDLGENTITVTDGVWHHAVAQFDGTYRRLYVDGIMTAQDTPGSDHNVTNISNFAVGVTAPGLGEYFSGWISNLRIVRGVAVYSGTNPVSANFTVPTSNLPATQSASFHISAITAGQCSLLLNTTPGNVFADSSGNNYTLTPHGSVVNGYTAPFGAGIGIQQNGGKSIAIGI